MKQIKKKLAILMVFSLIPGLLFPGGASALTVMEERKMGEEYIKAVKQHYDVVDDPLVTGYVNRVAKKITKVLPSRHFDYTFNVVKEDVYNAFAGPGGHIFINSGLIEAMESEGELAGILGHEVSHVACRHISEYIENSKKVSFGTLAGVTAGLLLGLGGASTAAQAVTMGSLAMGKSIALKYSRGNETQADEFGLRYLVKAGYSGKWLIRMLEKIQEKQWYGSEEIPTYLTTHPAPDDRIGRIKAWMAENEKDVVFPEIDNRRFNLVKARIMGMYGDKEAGAKRFEKRLEKDGNDYFAHYGYGLLLARIGDRKAGAKHIGKALEKDPFNQYLLKDLGRIYYLDGLYEKALKTLESAELVATEKDVENPFYKGRTYLSLGRFKEAVLMFEEILNQKPEHPEASYFLGESYGKLGRIGEAHYHLGVHYNALQKPEKALFHYKKAVGKLTDPDKKLKSEMMIKKLEKAVSRIEKKPAERKRRF